MARRGRLILIVDPDLDFVEDTRLLLNGERLLTARSLEEAEEIADGGRVDAAVLGPSFGNEAGVRAAAALLAVDPTIHLVLAANVVTNRVLLAALQTGFADVVDTPLTVRKLANSLAARARAQAAPPPRDVIVEVAPALPAAVPVSPAVAAPAAVAEPVLVSTPAPTPVPVFLPVPAPAPVPVPAALPEPAVIALAPTPDPVSPTPSRSARPPSRSSRDLWRLPPPSPRHSSPHPSRWRRPFPWSRPQPRWRLPWCRPLRFRRFPGVRPRCRLRPRRCPLPSHPRRRRLRRAPTTSRSRPRLPQRKLPRRPSLLSGRNPSSPTARRRLRRGQRQIAMSRSLRPARAG